MNIESLSEKEQNELKEYIMEYTTQHNISLYYYQSNSRQIKYYFYDNNNPMPSNSFHNIKSENRQFIADNFIYLLSNKLLGFNEYIPDLYKNAYHKSNNLKRNLLDFICSSSSIQNTVSVLREKEYFFNFLDIMKNRSGGKYDFNSIFSIMKKYSFDNQEDVSKLLNFSKNFRVIIKRVDTIPHFTEFIKNKVAKEFQPIFAKAFKISFEDKPKESIFQVNQSLSLELNKKIIFNNIHFSHVPIPDVLTINRVHKCVEEVFNDQLMKEYFQIESAKFWDFDSKRLSTSILFNTKDSSKHEEISKVYTELLEVLAHHYKHDIRLFNHMEIASKWFLSYQLEQEIKENKSHKTSKFKI